MLLDTSVIPILSEMHHLRRLAGNFRGLFAGIDFTQPIYSSLTHLDIFDGGWDLSILVAAVSVLPALTHLCLNTQYWDRVKEDSSGVFVGCPTLEVLLFQWSMVTTMGMDEYESNKEPRILDVRIVIGVYDDYFDEWEADARGSLSFWAEADSFVSKKRKGEIEGQLALLSVD
ncbi:hypothetical protein R3P38DRAFT_3227272 [Favolaschia claudopus]|uniref:Uncharacterized protein n=1 Tax=Favolaschia claudopus TaxID=2862362 RepID=A0AAV9ZSG8_9AGAR